MLFVVRNPITDKNVQKNPDPPDLLDWMYSEVGSSLNSPGCHKRLYHFVMRLSYNIRTNSCPRFPPVSASSIELCLFYNICLHEGFKRKHNVKGSYC
jgi:hypothetical protein